MQRFLAADGHMGPQRSCLQMRQRSEGLLTMQHSTDLEFVTMSRWIPSEVSYGELC